MDIFETSGLADLVERAALIVTPEGAAVLRRAALPGGPCDLRSRTARVRDALRPRMWSGPDSHAFVAVHNAADTITDIELGIRWGDGTYPVARARASLALAAFAASKVPA